MIQEGFNGITDINSNKVSEEYFLSHVEKTGMSKVLHYFNHRDTQERESCWRIQGVIKTEFLNEVFMVTKTFNNVMIKMDKEGLLLTFCLPKI